MKAYKQKLGKSRLADLTSLRKKGVSTSRPTLQQGGPEAVTPKMRAASKYAIPESTALKEEFRELLQADLTPKAVVSKSDQQLFATEMRDVQPLISSGRILTHASPVLLPEQAKIKQHNATGEERIDPVLVQTSDYYVASLFEESNHEYLSSACGTDVMQNLKKSRWPILASLDLHGATLDEARALVGDFIHECIDHRIKCVRIVHGVGYGSKNKEGPVLLPTVRRWLSQLHDVLAFCECAPHEGGKGAVKLILRTYR